VTHHNIIIGTLVVFSCKWSFPLHTLSMSTGHELPGSNLLNVEDRRASTHNDTEPGSGVEEELPNVKTMDFISSNPKCPLEIVHESFVSHLTHARQNSGLSYHLFPLCKIGLLLLSLEETQSR
jgi:hypothetical protein